MNAKVSAIVGTVGRLNIDPGAANSIAERVTLTADIRSSQADEPEELLKRVDAEVSVFLHAESLSVERKVVSVVPPTLCSNAVCEAISSAVQILDATAVRLPSGAGHDGCFVSRLGPIGMIFTPCKDGISHAPDEWLEPHQAELGANLLLQTLLELDSNPSINEHGT